MGETTPFFIVWIITWAGLFLYLMRLDGKLRELDNQ